MVFGVIGLGKMGSALAAQAIDKGFDVVGVDPIGSEFLSKLGASVTPDISQLRTLLPPPRTVFLWVPAGPTVDKVLGQLTEILEAGDTVVDGGNSYFRDSQVRYGLLRGHGIRFIDCGTSGGIEGARNGACFMVGGETLAVDRVAPILEALAVEGGFLRAGGPGAGHFVKLVHNAIEFGMLQAIGEGFAMLEGSDFDLDLAAVFENWSNGSVIRSWLIELMAAGLAGREDVSDVSPYVEDTGEVNWAVEEAMGMDVPIPVIAQSIMELMSSRDSSKRAHRAVAMMRNGFGGHPFGPSEPIARERRTGKVDLALRVSGRP